MKLASTINCKTENSHILSFTNSRDIILALNVKSFTLMWVKQFRAAQHCCRCMYFNVVAKNRGTFAFIKPGLQL